MNVLDENIRHDQGEQVSGDKIYLQLQFDGWLLVSFKSVNLRHPPSSNSRLFADEHQLT